MRGVTVVTLQKWFNHKRLNAVIQVSHAVKFVVAQG